MSDSPALVSTERGVGRNTLWNLAGQTAPLLAAVFAIPVLISGLGIERFGVLTLAWMVIGYFSLFDLGLGRALTMLVSERLGGGRPEEIPELVWTGLVLMGCLGLLGAGVTLALSGWLVTDILKVPFELQSETAVSFRLLAYSVPIVILTTGLRGVLEAYQRFDLVNLARIPLGMLTFLSPVVVLEFSNHLDVMVAVLLGLRILICIIHVILCARVLPGLLRQAAYSNKHLKRMVGFGGWMTVSNVVGPLMVYLDRFVIGSFLGMAAVAYYVTPYEIVTKLWVIPSALVGVLFPVFSASMNSERIRATDLFWRGVHWIFVVLFPVVLLITMFASDGLRLWVSEDFSDNSTATLQWLAVGVLINSLAHVPFAFIQGVGRPDLTAKVHLIELPFYLVALWIMMSGWGLVGAAVAWSLRIAVDVVAMFGLSLWLESELRWDVKREMLILTLGLLTICLATFSDDIAIRVVIALVVLSCFPIFAWCYLLKSDDRVFVRRIISSALRICTR